MKRAILVTGAGGQVGIEVARMRWPEDIHIDAPSRDELDIGDPSSVSAYFESRPPQCVINLAAYTAVDKAEDEVAQAFLVNCQGAALIAEAARRVDAPVVHVSTDYVFDGSANRPYLESDRTAPLSAYGASKLAGELAVRTANRRSVVLRTAWVLSPHRTNFIKTMLRLASDKPELRIVADQRGCPTSARDIAWALKRIALRAMDDSQIPWGTYHFVNMGETSWHGLAEYVFDWQAARGSPRPKVNAIRTSEYPTPARRPSYSCLNTGLISDVFGIQPRRWQEAVDEILQDLAAGSDGGTKQ